MKIEVSIIIVSFNNPFILKQTIVSIKDKIDVPSYEIIVVDNASVEGNVRMIKDDLSDVILIENPTNSGFGYACNLGAKNASGEYLLFVNSDIVLNGNPIPEMINIFNRFSDVGVVGCQLLNPDGSLQPSHFRFPGLLMRFLQLSKIKYLILKLLPSARFKRDKIYEVDFVSGAFLMIKSELFFKLGGFDKRYFMYLEDADLCYQARKSGKINYGLNTNVITHLNENYEDVENPFVFKHLNKSQLLFYKKNYSKGRKRLLIIMTCIFYWIRIVELRMKRNSGNEIEQLKEVISFYKNG